MVVQLTYSTTHNAAYAGQGVTFLPNALWGKLNKSGVVIPYGKGVVSDGDDAAQLPVIASTAAQFIGVAFYEINRAQADGAVAGAVNLQDFTVMSHGVIWVFARNAVVKDDPVYLITDDTSDPDFAGDFDNVASAGDRTAVLISGAKFITSGADGDLVQISFGLGG